MKPLTIVAHDSTFHTDDVFACATLRLVFLGREINIIRTRNQEEIEKADIVVDVGSEYDPARMRFDHHQKGGAGERDNGIPYASFGLVWKEFGVQVAGTSEAAQYIEERLVYSIDAHDNGKQYTEQNSMGYMVGDIISSLRPAWREDRDINRSFFEAIDLAMLVLKRLIVHTSAFNNGSILVREAYVQAINKQIIILEDEYPGWKEILIEYPEPLFVVYQRVDKKWSAKGVPIESQSFILRKKFPEAWASLRNSALQEVTGVKDAVFCHNNGFIVVAESKEGILKLVSKALIL